MFKTIGLMAAVFLFIGCSSTSKVNERQPSSTSESLTIEQTEKAYTQSILISRDTPCILKVNASSKKFECAIDLKDHFRKVSGVITEISPNSILAPGVSEGNEYFRLRAEGASIFIEAPARIGATRLNDENVAYDFLKKIITSNEIRFTFVGNYLHGK